MLYVGSCRYMYDYDWDYFAPRLHTTKEIIHFLENIDNITQTDIIEETKDGKNDFSIWAQCTVQNLDSRYVEEGILIISGDKHALYNDKGAKVVRRELKQSSFKRQFELGEQLDGDNIKASFKDGLLSIDIPKVEPAKPDPTKVEVK